MILVGVMTLTISCTEKERVEVPVDRMVEVQGTSGIAEPGGPGNAATTPSGGTQSPVVTVEGGGAVVTKDVIEPTVTAMNPSDGLQGVAPSSTITINFSESVDPASVSKDSIQLKDSSGVMVDGAVTYNEEQKTATLTPTVSLLDSEQYTLTITKAVRDLAGNAKLEEDVATFRVSAVKTIALAIGGSHTLALKENGQVWAWGRNNNGQLGINSRTDQNRPVRVNGLQDITAIAAGGLVEFSLALDKDGHVWAWGGNRYGQLGDGTTQDRLTPYQVGALENIIAISAGNSQSFALADDGHVWVWGNNNFGQLGNGTTQDSLVPVQNPFLNHVKAIISGSSLAMALVEDPETQERTLRTWGYGLQGQMGDGTMPTTPVTTPVQVKTPDGTGILTNVDQIAINGATSYAVLKDKTLLAWGGNFNGLVGDGTTTHRSLPVEVMKDVVHVGSGPFSITVFAVTSDSALWGWGRNNNLLLMEATSSDSVTKPRRIGTVSGVIMARAGYYHSALLKADGSVITAGLNVNGELGNGSASFYNYRPNWLSTVPASTQSSGRFVQTQTGSVRAWGRNVDCELGMPKQGAEMMIPTEIAIPDKVIQVAGSGVHMLALTDKNEVWAWGRNEYGELGNGTSGAGQKSCVPQKVKGEGGVGTLGNIVAITAGKCVDLSKAPNYISLAASYAIQKNPDDTTTVWYWGHNCSGGVTNTPLKVAFPADAAPITQIANSTHALALTKDGKVYAWGSNYFGQYCSGATTASATPVFTGMTGVAQVAAGNYHTVLRMTDGTVKTCGLGRFGQLGNGVFTSSSAVTATPQDVQGMGPVKYIAAGGYMSAAITQDGKLLAWGRNLWGQLGVGNSIDQSLPTPVRLADGTEFGDVAQVSLGFNNVADYSGTMTAIRNDGTVWDLGFSNIPPTYLIREGETAILGVPQTVNWP